jgi:hypothetical protein
LEDNIEIDLIEKQSEFWDWIHIGQDRHEENFFEPRINRYIKREEFLA